jgi:hypothetical protein
MYVGRITTDRRYIVEVLNLFPRATLTIPNLTLGISMASKETFFAKNAEFLKNG